MFPEAFSEAVEVTFDASSRRVVAHAKITFHDLVLRNGPADVPNDRAAALLAAQVVAGTCPLKNWDNAVEQWIARVNCAATWFPELQIPPIGEEDKLLLIEQICSGAVSYKDIKDRQVWPTVKSWLPPHQQAAIEQLAPERIELPNGRKAKIAYDVSGSPSVAARIQDLYGVERNLTLGRARVPLVIQVLAPNHRPIQITSDLEGFWRDAYPKIKKELQRKYPKHEWR